MAERYADASARAEAREILQILADRGRATESELAELENLKASEAADKEAIGATRAMGRGMVQGATLSAGDEIGAGLGALLSRGDGQSLSDAYSQQLGETRAKNEAAAQAFPKEYSRGQFVGGAATSAVPIGAGLGMAKGASALTQAAIGGLTGSGVAALNDFNAGEGGALSRASNISIPNVATGAISGSAAPIAGKLAGSLLGNRMAPVGKPLMRAGFDPKAARIATRSVTDDASGRAALGEDLKSYLQNMGDDAMIIDAGRNTRFQGRALAGTPGAGATQLEIALAQRNAGTADRVNAGLDAATGAVENQAALTAARKVARTSEASPLYEAAKASPQPLDMRGAVSSLDSMIADRAPGAASLRKFRKALAEDPRPVVIHNIRSDVDGMARAAWANNPSHAATYRKLVEELDAQLDSIPGYANARSTWADSKALDDASTAGGKFMDGQDSDQLRAYFEGLSAPEKEAYRSAARRALDLKLGRAQAEDTKAASLMGPRELRAKVDIVFGDGTGEKLLARETTERAFKETRNRVSSGSDTAATSVANRELAPLMDETGARLGPFQRVKRAAVDDPLNRFLDDLSRKPKGKSVEDLARILTAKGPERDALVTAILNDGAQVSKNKRVSERTKRLLEALVGGAGSGIAVSGSN